MEATDDAFWDQFWADTATSVQDVFALVPAAEIRAVREESPSNLATLCYKVRGARPLAVTPTRAIPHSPREAGAGPALWSSGAGTQDSPPAEVAPRLHPLSPGLGSGGCAGGTRHRPAQLAHRVWLLGFPGGSVVKNPPANAGDNAV